MFFTSHESMFPIVRKNLKFIDEGISKLGYLIWSTSRQF